MSIRPRNERSDYTSDMQFQLQKILPADPVRATRSWRWVAVLLVSILLHCLALDWATGVVVIPTRHETPDDAIAIVQLQAPLLPAPAIVKPKQVTKPRPHRVAKAAPKTAPEVPPTFNAVAAPSTALTQDVPGDTATVAAQLPPPFLRHRLQWMT
jgi:hypothetical protein